MRAVVDNLNIPDWTPSHPPDSSTAYILPMEGTLDLLTLEDDGGIVQPLEITVHFSSSTTADGAWGSDPNFRVAHATFDIIGKQVTLVVNTGMGDSVSKVTDVLPLLEGVNTIAFDCEPGKITFLLNGLGPSVLLADALPTPLDDFGCAFAVEIALPSSGGG